MAKHNDLGRNSEDIAVKHLKEKGYCILERNWIAQKKELDIIAIHENQLVIVEVKSRSSENFEHPSDAITKRKIKNIVHATQMYVDQKGVDFEVRFDVVAVIWKKNESYHIEHIKDAFIAPVE